MSTHPALVAEHYADPYHRGECERWTHAADGSCRETGCQLRFELRLDPAGIVEEAWFDADGCPWCEGVASWLAERAEGATAADIGAWTSTDLTGWLDAAQCELPACVLVVLQTLQGTLSHRDLGGGVDGEQDAQFGGPSLREEC